MQGEQGLARRVRGVGARFSAADGVLGNAVFKGDHDVGVAGGVELGEDAEPVAAADD